MALPSWESAAGPTQWTTAALPTAAARKPAPFPDFSAASMIQRYTPSKHRPRSTIFPSKKTFGLESPQATAASNLVSTSGYLNLSAVSAPSAASMTPASARPLRSGAPPVAVLPGHMSTNSHSLDPNARIQSVALSVNPSGYMAPHPVPQAAPPTRPHDGILEQYEDLHAACAEIDASLDNCFAVVAPQGPAWEPAASPQVPVNLAGCCRRLREMQHRAASLHAQQQRWYAATIAECSRKVRIASSAAADSQKLELTQHAQAELAAKDSQVKELTARLAACQDELGASKQQINVLQSQLDAARSDRVASDETITSVRSELQAAVQAADAHQAQAVKQAESIAHLQEQLQAAEARGTDLESQLQEAQGRVTALTASAGAARAADAGRTQQLQAMQGEVHHTNQALDDITAQCAAAETELGALADAANRALVTCAADGIHILERMRVLMGRTATHMPAALARKLEHGLLSCKVDADVWYSRVLAAAHHARTREIGKIPAEFMPTQGGDGAPINLTTASGPIADHRSSSMSSVHSSGATAPAAMGGRQAAVGPQSISREAQEVALPAHGATSVVSDSSSIRLLRMALAHDLEEQSMWDGSDSEGEQQGGAARGETTEAPTPDVGTRYMTAKPSKFLKQLDEYLSRGDVAAGVY